MNGTKRTILVAEDEFINREILSEILVSFGKEIFASYQSLIADGIGTEPAPLERPSSSLDNSYVSFSDGQKLEGTAIVIQASAGEETEV